MVVWPDSNKIDRNKLDDSKCYLQLTSVKPYYEPEEKDQRITYFQKYTLLSM